MVYREKKSRRCFIYQLNIWVKRRMAAIEATTTNAHFTASIFVTVHRSLVSSSVHESNGWHKYRLLLTRSVPNAADKYYRILPKPFVEKYAATWAERSVWF